ncbi:DUF6270 domain-containing protein [Planktothrix agardhii 1032]|nr:DUF6270 domain-containing protein [Planktothrix agardhii 1032]
MNNYSARSSLISRVSIPVKLDISQYLKQSKLPNFESRMIKEDFEKNFSYLEKFEGFTVIIDLIDERFSLIKLQDSYITRSEQFVQSGIYSFLEKEFGKNIEYIHRGTYKDFDLWVESCKKFSEIMKKLQKNNIIIFHKVFQAKFYLKDTQLKEFEDIAKIELHNENLSYYYNVFEEICQPQHIIQVPSEKTIAQANHQWGLAPMHFTDEYYQECYSQLIHITNNRNTETETSKSNNNLTYKKSFNLFSETNDGELTDVPKWAVFLLDKHKKYAIRGQIASNYYPIHNQALVQFKFLDKNHNYLKPPYEGILESQLIGPYKYIPINDKSLSSYVIKFIVPNLASYVELGFRSWYNSKPIIMASTVKLYSIE